MKGEIFQELALHKFYPGNKILIFWLSAIYKHYFSMNKTMENSTLKDNNEITYMNVKTISTYLGVAKSTIYKWAESGFIPHKKLRKHVLFIKKDIDQWVLNNGEVISDLPEIPKYTEIGKDLVKESHRIPSYKEVLSVVKYRKAS